MTDSLLCRPATTPAAATPVPPRSRLSAALACAALALSVCVASAQPAQDYPSKPVQILVGFPPGQSIDTHARMWADQLAQQMGQSMVVINRPGQAGSIAAAQLKRAPADGHTVAIMATASMVTNPHLYAQIGYDPLTDLQPVSTLSVGPLVLVAHPSLPATSVKELIEHARAQPNRLNYCTPGNGTLSHLAMEDFKRRAGVSLVHVPYQGSAKAMTDLMAGLVAVCFDTMTVTRAHVDSGKLRVLAIAAPERSPVFPGVPTMAEAGFPGFVAMPWAGLFVPAGTPQPVVRRLHAEVLRAAKSPEFAERISRSSGIAPSVSTPEEFAARIRQEHGRWGAAIREAGIRVD